MGLQNQNVSIVNAVEIGNNGPSVELNNRPTLIVSRSTAEPVTKSLNLTGYNIVNFQSGCAALLQSATLVKNAVYLFVYTGGAAAAFVTLALDNSGTINGSTAPYILQSGSATRFMFDGTNFGTPEIN